MTVGAPSDAGLTPFEVLYAVTAHHVSEGLCSQLDDRTTNALSARHW